MFTYISLIFLAIWLSNSGYLNLPTIQDWFSFLVSLLLVFLGFLASARAWQKILELSDYNISFWQAVASIGLTIFGKYVPGKLWVIVGRVGYLLEYRPDASFAALSSLSLNAQIITVWIGLLIGIATFWFTDFGRAVTWTAIGLSIFLTVVLFTNTIGRFCYWLVLKFGKKEIGFNALPRAQLIIRLIPAFLLPWGLWCTGFTFFVSALTGNNIEPVFGLAFALATTLGIVTFVSPGGLGVREGILTGLLLNLGLSLQETVTISVASRLWFLCGEVFIFIVGLIGHNNYNSNSTQN